MPSQQPTAATREQSDTQRDDEQAAVNERHEMPCPLCGAAMPDLKGGKASICPVCGFKDSCCY